MNATNSNSWAQSIVEYVIGQDNVEENFRGNDLLYWKRIGRAYFEPVMYAVTTSAGWFGLKNWTVKTVKNNGEVLKEETFTFGFESDQALFGDFDFDGVPDAIVTRGLNNGQREWLVNLDSDSGPERKFLFGWNTDSVLFGDANGDGFSDPVAVRKQTDGLLGWYVRSDRTPGYEYFVYGWSTDTPLLGDLDNDGVVNAIAVRKQSNGLQVWFVSQNYDYRLRSFSSIPKYSFVYGWNGDTPIITYSAHGTATFGVVRREHNRVAWMIDVTPTTPPAPDMFWFWYNLYSPIVA